MRFNPYKLYTNYRKDYHFYGFYSGTITLKHINS